MRTMFVPSFLILIAVVSVHCIPTGDAESAVSDAFVGRNKSPADQCRERLPERGAGVCKASDPATRCAQLVCTEPGRTDIPVPIETGPALDGTYCGINKICVQGACVDDTQPPKNPLKITEWQYDCEDW